MCWEPLFAGGVVPREVAMAVSYTLGLRPHVTGIADEVRWIAAQAGLRIETPVEYRRRLLETTRRGAA